MIQRPIPAREETAGRKLLAYLRRLPIPEIDRLKMALSVLEQHPGIRDTDVVPKLLEKVDPAAMEDDPRLAPDISRSSMVPEHVPRKKWLTFLKALLWGEALNEETGRSGREYLNVPWCRAARRRRILLALVILIPTVAAVSTMGSVLPHQGSTPIEAAVLAVFSVLFAWISVGFWTASFGFYTLLRRIDRVTVTHDMEKHSEAPRSHVRTAILFPVCNEDMDRVMAGVAATYLSVARTGLLPAFDFFILSDTQDPDAWMEELAAWRRTRDRLEASGRLFYRRRKMNIKRKSGNIADFCRRYGAKYTYMVVMDADSVMSGETLTRLVSIMEHKRNVGILQTAPSVSGRTTFLARVQQFANRTYGPMFAAGLHFMQLGDAQFWGHNAIIRIRPFMKHCALPRLSGRPPLGGDIMSHDFVEAALMRRAGWGVWLAFDLGGSYEESPPTLLAELKRDRRWCQGNLQHLRLLFTRGLFPAHRALFLNGAMAYGSAFLWFLFIVLSSAEAILEAVSLPVYFPVERSLFPTWPVWDPGWAMSLLATTGVLLFLPKAMSYVLILAKGQSRLFGGPIRLAVSILAEILTSSLLAPIRMLFHSKFVFMTILGKEAGWGQQQRDDSGTSWRDAIRFHMGGTILAALWGSALFLYNRSFFWWIMPIFLPLVLAIPISYLTSRAGLGLFARRIGIFLTPEEVETPRELKELAMFQMENTALPPSLGIPRGRGFARAILDPAIHFLHLSSLRRPRSLDPDIRIRREILAEKAVHDGPESLTAMEKKEILADPGDLSALHRRSWALPMDELERKWGMREL